MSRFIFITAFLFLAYGGFGQYLPINGNILTESDSPEGAKIVIFKNGNKIDEHAMSRKGRFDFRLALDGDYRISFEKPGYVTKIVSINTEVPPEIVESNPNFPPVKLIINLLPQVEGADLSIFEQPVAILTYNYELDDFNFDKEYAQKIRERIAKAEQDMKRILAERGSAALAQERQFAEWVAQGQAGFDRERWTEAIDKWKQALALKPDNEELPDKIALAEKKRQQEEAQRATQQQNEQRYRNLVARGDSLFQVKSYRKAQESYQHALSLNSQDPYPQKRITEINRLLAQLAEQERAEANRQAIAQKYQHTVGTADSLFRLKNYNEAETIYRKALTLNVEKEYPTNQLKRIAQILAQQATEAQEALALENKYNKAIAEADQAWNNQNYTQAITSYQYALTLKPGETYPTEKLTKARQAQAALEKRLAAEAEQKRLEEERLRSLRARYQEWINLADASFKDENYNLAKQQYMEAHRLGLPEEYPQKQITTIDNIINSSKYQNRLADYNKNKTLAEKSMQEKNYASAKVYYQRALEILPLNKEEITQQITEIDKLIEAAQLAAVQREYKAHIAKADKAYQEKAYAVAKFYYQKALEVKLTDKYATARLQEVEKHINDRQEKGANL